MSAQYVVEYAPFTLAKGVSEEALLAASKRLEDEMLARMQGYRGRVLVKKSAQEWADLVFWQDRETADRAMQHAKESQICAAYFSLMDMTGVSDPNGGVTHFAAVQSYGGVRL